MDKKIIKKKLKFFLIKKKYINIFFLNMRLDKKINF